MKEGTFREDLYDRLAFQTVHTPPLRTHVEDVPELAAHFLGRFRREVPGVSARQVTERALGRLAAYPWPGNVREMKNVIERAAAAVAGDSIEAEHLELRAGGEGPAAGSFAEQVRAFERALIREALESADFQQSRAAEILHMSYDQFRHYYRKYRDEIEP